MIPSEKLIDILPVHAANDNEVGPKGKRMEGLVEIMKSIIIDEGNISFRDLSKQANHENMAQYNFNSTDGEIREAVHLLEEEELVTHKGPLENGTLLVYNN